METAIKPSTAIVGDLDNQILFCDETIKTASQRMNALNYDGDDFNLAWNEYASTSVMLRHFTTLKGFVSDGEEALVENFIRFMIYRIELSTPADALTTSKPTDDPILNGKLIVYNKFKTYLKKISK